MSGTEPGFDLLDFGGRTAIITGGAIPVHVGDRRPACPTAATGEVSR